jgi:hypothetical protein
MAHWPVISEIWSSMLAECNFRYPHATADLIIVYLVTFSLPSPPSAELVKQVAAIRTVLCGYVNASRYSPYERNIAPDPAITICIKLKMCYLEP